MLEIINNTRSAFEALQLVSPGQKVLVIADNEYQNMLFGQVVMDLAISLGAEPTLVAINPTMMKAKEPLPFVAAAMKSVDTIIRLSNHPAMIHTNARKDATAAGVRFCILTMEDIKYATSLEDVKLIEKRTKALAELLSHTKIATVTSPAGTNISMSLSGRPSLALQPLDRNLGGGSPHYAEAAIAPVEGTANGVIVIDIAFVDWEHLLREPIRLTVKNGNVIDVSGSKQEAGKLREIIANHDNAGNIAELGIGTSHTVPQPVLGVRKDCAILGTAHFGLGRNNDFGGHTKSDIHLDALMDNVTIELDNKIVLKDGRLTL